MSVSVAVGAEKIPCRWEKERAYAKGEIVFWLFIPCEAVAAIPKDTLFAWQTAADVGVNQTATWRPLINSDRTWRGIYSDSSSYAVNDIVAGDVQGRLFTCDTAASAGSANNPYYGTNRGMWAPIQNSAGFNYTGATATDKGLRGLVPDPPAKSNNAPLMGDGAFGLNVQTPANNAAGLQGNMCIDANYLYIWTGDSQVKRVALSSF